MDWNTIVDWLEINWAYVLIIAIIVLILFRNKIKSWFKKKEPEELNFPPKPANPELSLFDDVPSEDVPLTLDEQKKNLETQIKFIKDEGKKIIRDEERIKQEKKHLGNRFEILVSQLKLVNKMIDDHNNLLETQRKMKEQMRRLK